MLETRPEPGDRRTRTSRLLIYVLDYDDLLALRTTQFTLDRVSWPLAIGRASDAELRLHGGRLSIPDAFMSGEHARVERRGDALIVHDADSRNGTWVNGRRVTEHRLADGDLIEVGHSLLCYREVADSLLEALDEAGDAPCLGPTRTHNAEMAALGRALAKIGPSAEPVLILAETGSGKEVAAGALHTMSGRSGAFRAVDCGAVPESLFESTFFGHRKGAFTGADDHRVGEIALADRGTLFLDEVGNMTPPMQAKLLRTIETGEVTPVGATEARRVDVRWVAATNRDLFADGDGFREDLLRRLAGYVARIPPLARRREDLGVLTAHLLRDAGVDSASITPAAARVLYGQSFPGNIRQLRATLRSAALLATNAAISLEHLPQDAPGAASLVAPTASSPAPAPAAERRSRPQRATTPDADAVLAALTETGGNVVRAAEILGTHARQLYRWIERYGLDLDSLRRE